MEHTRSDRQNPPRRSVAAVGATAAATVGYVAVAPWDVTVVGVAAIARRVVELHRP